MIKTAIVFSAFLVTILTFLFAANVAVYADDSTPCIPIYGGGCLTQSQSQAQTVNITNPPVGSVGVGTSAQVSQVLGIKELPKTGSPAAALALSGLLVPAGFWLRRFAANNSINKDCKDGAGYIWQIREFLKGGEK